MAKLYGTQRYERIGNVSLENNTSLNGVYTASFYLNGQFKDWNNAGITNIIDQQIPEERYIGEIVTGVPKLTRFISCEYNENYVDSIELQRSLENVGARFNIDIFETKEDCIERLKLNTDLEEIETGKFLISKEIEIDGEVIPAVYIVIE